MTQISKLLKEIRIISLLVIIFPALAWGMNNAEKHPPKPPEWRIKGCITAINDSDPEVVIATLKEKYCTDNWPFIGQNHAQGIAELLENKDIDIRKIALNALVKIGATEQAPDIVNWLKKTMDARTQIKTIKALVSLNATDQIPVIVQWLTEEEKHLRYKAIKALTALGAISQAAVIAERLEDNHSSVREAAIRALAELGAIDQIPAISKKFKDKDSFVRWAAIEALVKLGASAQIPAIIERLTDEDSRVREAAIKALVKIGSTTEASVIAERFRDKDYLVRKAAIEALGEMKANSQISAIAALLKEDDVLITRDVVTTLAKLKATTEIPAIVKCLDIDDMAVQLRSLDALGKLSANDQIPAIAKKLNSGIYEVRIAAFKTLGKLDSKLQLPAIAKRLEANNDFVDEHEIKLLSNFDTKEYASAISEKLKDGNWQVRLAASKVLGALQATTQILDIVKLLKDKEDRVRSAAIKALKNLEAKEQTPLIIELLADEYVSVREAAIETLVAFGATEQLPIIKEMLNGDKAEARQSAVELIGAFGAKELIPDIVLRLKDHDFSVRRSAIKVLRKMKAIEQLPDIVELLSDSNSTVYYMALDTMEELGIYAPLPTIASWLKNQNDKVRWEALNLLGKLGAIEYSSEITELLNDDRRGPIFKAIEVLAELGAKDQISVIAKLLDSSEYEIRVAALEALAILDAKEQIPGIVKRLNDEVPAVHQAAIKALGKLGAKEQTSVIAERLNYKLPESRWAVINDMENQASVMPEISAKYWMDHASSLRNKATDEVYFIRLAASNALLKLGSNNPVTYSTILEIALNKPSRRAQLWALAHVMAGGNEHFETMLNLLIDRTIRADRLDSKNINNALAAYLYFWEKRGNYSSDLRKMMSGNIARLVKEVGPAELDSNSLRKVRDIVQEDFPLGNDIFNQALASQEKAKTMLMASVGVSGHLVFWLLLILVYPHNRPVQAIFFWNPWVRKLLGFGYVGFLLTWLPPLRRRLLSPFKAILLSDARLDEFDEAAYFRDSQVRSSSNHSIHPILDELTILRGQVLLEGDSGLGKTFFIRWHLKQSRRLAVYLPAQRCGKGVLSAIQTKLIGYAEDERFLKSLIFSGALDVYIDGLNETSPETHVLIKQFAEDFFHANLLLSSQPMKWEPPVSVRVLELQALDQPRIKTFLLSRTLHEDAKLTQSEYDQAVTKFLDLYFGRELNEKTTQRMHIILSNPLDLSVIAEMLARGDVPDVFNLQQQFFEHMAKNYAVENCGQSFPLKEFTENIYALRKNNEWMTALRETWLTELDYLTKYRLMIRRDVEAGNAVDKNIVTRWYFRHDKIQDFFLSKAFFDKPERQNEHMNDARFRGVYFYLASRLPMKQALNLRDRLIEYAADHSDHTVSDAYIKILRTRQDWASIAN